MCNANAPLIAAKCTVTLAAWELMGIPVSAPARSGELQSYAFSPLRAEHDPVKGSVPTVPEVDADLALLAPPANALHIHRVRRALALLPVLAETHGLAATLGACLGGNEEHSRAERARFVEVAAGAGNAAGVFGDNEMLLRKTLTRDQLLGYLGSVRPRVEVAVGTAILRHVWLQHSLLAEHLDVVSVHVLPFWGGVPLDDAVSFLVEHIAELRTALSNKPPIIGEEGRPSRGRSRRGAAASPFYQALFLRQFLTRQALQGADYFLMEVFDQPWRKAAEGEVGANWGKHDSDHRHRFSFARPTEPIPPWVALAFLSVLLAGGGLFVLIRESGGLRRPGRAWLAATSAATGVAMVWVVRDQACQHWTPTTVVVDLFLAAGAVALVGALPPCLGISVGVSPGTPAGVPTFTREVSRAVGDGNG